MKSEEGNNYAYLKIRDAIGAANQKVNLIGVVLEYGAARRTRGTDFVCTLKLIDESHHKPGISVNVFAEDLEKLPHIESAGDIIQLYGVVMRSHGGLVNAVFNKKISSFALYKGNDGKDLQPYQVSSRFCSRDQDKKYIAGLRKWLDDFEIDEDSKDFMLLREIKEQEQINLICKVLHICDIAKDVQMAYIWDGTDTPPIGIHARLEDEMDNPLPLQLESLPLSRDLLCSFPAVGTILRVIIDIGNVKHGLRLHPGKWMKFINLHCEVHNGFWRGVLVSSTKVRYLPEDDRIVCELQRSYDARALSKWDRMSSWSFPWPSRITEVENDDVPVVTLMEVLTSSKVSAKFHCAVRVVALFPWRAEDFRSPVGTYRIRLTLEDPTARIHAFLYAEDGETFFDGYPCVDELTRKRNKLLGMTVSDDGKEVMDAPRNPPFVQCYLRSYYLDKTDVWGSRQFRIVATKVV